MGAANHSIRLLAEVCDDDSTGYWVKSIDAKVTVTDLAADIDAGPTENRHRRRK